MVLRYGMLGSRYCQSAILRASLRGTKQSPTLQSKYAYRLLVLRSRSLPRRLSPFVFATKGPKRLVSRNASLQHRPFPCKSGKTWAAIFLPCCRYALWPLPFCKNLLCPAIAHKATIVLPDFTRNCSTDEKGKRKKRGALTTRAGQGSGGNAGLAFCVMCRYEVPK